jgi:hypothetical protein
MLAGTEIFLNKSLDRQMLDASPHGNEQAVHNHMHPYEK